MVSIQDRVFTSPLRTQNKLPPHIMASFNTPPVSNFEKLSFFSPDRSKLPSTPISPNVEFSSPETPSPGDFLKRGRPKAAMIHTLINKGHSVESSIRCRHCSRVFPREKSLAAHMRTHTGEKPYICDYPSCFKAFCQSGQLKTHQRLHSGEKPFICSAKDCQTRFTHSNRHCPDHPCASLLRDDNYSRMPEVDADCSKAVRDWFKRYYSSRQERTPYKHRVTSPPPSSTKRSLFGSPEMIHERENTTPPSTSFSSPTHEFKTSPLDSHKITEIVKSDVKIKNENNVPRNKSLGDLNNNTLITKNNHDTNVFGTLNKNIAPQKTTFTNNSEMLSLSSQHNFQINNLNFITSSSINNNIIQQPHNLANNNILQSHDYLNNIPPIQQNLYTDNYTSNSIINAPNNITYSNISTTTVLSNNRNMMINNDDIISDDTTTLREEVVVEEAMKDDTMKGAMALLELANSFLSKS